MHGVESDEHEYEVEEDEDECICALCMKGLEFLTPKGSKYYVSVRND